MECILVAVDVRSSHNIGSLFRTCDGLGVKAFYMSGITPHPKGLKDDRRLPHIAEKTDKEIHKTALGAEKTLAWHYFQDSLRMLKKIKDEGWTLCALEQANVSTKLTSYSTNNKVALIVGNEVDGLPKQILDICDVILEIPMVGKKESFNVSVAAAIGLFWLTNN